jgi:ABC-2 type transport system ATP-binding protein
MHVIKVENVTKRYGSAVVVDNLSFTAEPGRVTGFLGPNGSGKSTLMKILLGLASAEQGRATIGGKLYRDLTDPIRIVGAFLESNAFHPGRSGRDHMRILATGSGVSHVRVDELLELVGLASASTRSVRGYSLGMRQRLGLAVALLGDPQTLVLDEPGNGLDPGGMHWLRDLLRARAADGCAIFVSSHLLPEMEHLADDLVVIQKGRLVTTGTVSELRASVTLVRSPSAERLCQLLEVTGGTVQVRDDGSLLVRGLSPAEIGDRARAESVALHELTMQSSSLEDLFLGWTGDIEVSRPGVNKGAA